MRDFKRVTWFGELSHRLSLAYGKWELTPLPTPPLLHLLLSSHAHTAFPIQHARFTHSHEEVRVA